MATTTDVRSDAQIQADVLEELKWEPRLQPNEIGVIVKDGVVTLTGTMTSYTAKFAAEEAAHRVRGVKAVANDIEVKLFPGTERSDAAIAEAVVRALERDALIPIEKLEVTVSDGWVTLRGNVEWHYQREDAYDVVRRIAGVKGVRNLIVVKPKVSRTDLKKKIEDALVRTAQVDAKNITVEVQGPKVILKGTVRSWAEKQEAERQAWAAPGVTEVDNQITIK
jgi:osmotically-inducible protein OsmY